MRARTCVPVLLFAPALPWVAGCPGALVDRANFPAERPGPSTVCNAPARVLQPSCGTLMICHGANGTFGDFVSNPDGLIGKTVTGWSATADACKPPALLINGTGAPDGVLFKRIRGDECGTGTRMPMGATEPLAPDLVQCLTEWVTSKLPQASPPEDSALPGEEGDGGA